jgi:hypothetical protein
VRGRSREEKQRGEAEMRRVKDTEREEETGKLDGGGRGG